jgi:hypothetical protein
MSRAYDAVFKARMEAKPGDARENVRARAFWEAAERGARATPGAAVVATPYMGLTVAEERVWHQWVMPPVTMRIAAVLCAVALFVWLECASPLASKPPARPPGASAQPNRAQAGVFASVASQASDCDPPALSRLTEYDGLGEAAWYPRSRAL